MLRILALLGLSMLVGCSGGDVPDVRGRGGSTSATAEIRLLGDASFFGRFGVNVGPSDDRAYFEFNGTEDDPTNPARRNLGGNFFLGSEGVNRTVAGDWVEYTPTDPWLWIYDNRGSLVVFGPEIRDYIIRDFSYRANPDAQITVRFVAIAIDRLDGESRSVLPGDDLVVEISGHWTGYCTAYDDAGRVVDDPMMLLNPLCRQLLSFPG